MRIDVKGHTLTTKHIWFEQFDNIESIPKGDTVVVHMNDKPLIFSNTSFQKCELFTSLESDLSLRPDEWKISKSRRQEVKRSEKEGTTTLCYRPDDIVSDNSIITEYKSIYEGMYSEKGIDNPFPEAEINSYACNGALYISKAITRYNDCVFHSYLVENDRSRLYHSCSLFRGAEKEQRNIIGRANNLLTYNDMLYLKGIGVKRYDWGGCSSYENPNGIDQFKMYFGGTPVKYYIITLNSKKTVLFSSIKSILH